MIPFVCCFLVFLLHCTACGVLVPQPGMEPTPPALEGQSLNYWTIGKSFMQRLKNSNREQISDCLGLDIGAQCYYKGCYEYGGSFEDDITVLYLNCGSGCLNLYKTYPLIFAVYTSVQFSRSVMSDSLRPHEPQHTRPPCPSPIPAVYSNSCPLSL